MNLDRCIDFGSRARSLRVDTLVKLRWLAVGGQISALLVTYFILGFDLPLVLCLVSVAVSIWLNIGLRLRYGVNHRLGENPASVLLAFDIVQLASLLFFTGGLQNPFAILFLAPILISAVSLSLKRTLILVLVMIVAASFLAFHHYRLPWRADTELTLPLLYIGGIWIALVLGSTFIAAYAFRVADEARRLTDALGATELVLAREQHLTQLDGLAAAAAHELGTPLATITLVVREMRKLGPELGALTDDVLLLEQEVTRCRAILGKLTSLGSDGDRIWGALSLSQMIEEIIAPVRNFGVQLDTQLSGDQSEPSLTRNPAILYGLSNIIENAVDFARSLVTVSGGWSHEQVHIIIEDNGPGFPLEILARLGEPYVTSRSARRSAKMDEGGLGLGLFIAKTLLERTGATVRMENISSSGGARVTVLWSRDLFEGTSAQTVANRHDSPS
jgi:two-component system sensor histidine kinase RegB